LQTDPSIISLRDYAGSANLEDKRDAKYNLFLLSDTSALTNDRIWSERAVVNRDWGPSHEAETIRFPVVALYWAILNRKVTKDYPDATPAQLGNLLLREIESRKWRYEFILSVIHSSDNWPPKPKHISVTSEVFDIDSLYDKVQQNPLLRNALMTIRRYVGDWEGQQFDEIVTLDDRSHELGQLKPDWEFADHISEGYEAFQALVVLSDLMDVEEKLQKTAGSVIGVLDDKVPTLRMGRHSGISETLEEAYRHEYIETTREKIQEVNVERLTFTSLKSTNRARDLVLEIDIHPDYYCNCISWVRGTSLGKVVSFLDGLLLEHQCLDSSIAFLYGTRNDLELPLSRERNLTSRLFDEVANQVDSSSDLSGDVFAINPSGWYFLKVITSN